MLDVTSPCKVKMYSLPLAGPHSGDHEWAALSASRAHCMHAASSSSGLTSSLQEYELGSPVRAALLLEQAALFQLHRTPPLIHKFAFYIVLAGTEYLKCNLPRLRAHAYKCVSIPCCRFWCLLQYGCCWMLIAAP